jgi:folate-binding protein YgfZ
LSASDADPRIAELGYRLLQPSSVTWPSSVPQSLLSEDDKSALNYLRSDAALSSSSLSPEASVERLYQLHRTLLGVPEGPTDFTSGHSFPFEGTIDFLNGVSFDKGCYLGQELTARTFYSGVTRKRMFPLIVNAPTNSQQQQQPSSSSTSATPTLFPSWLFDSFDSARLSSGHSILLPSNPAKKTGKTLSCVFNVGFGMVRMEHLQSSFAEIKFLLGPKTVAEEGEEAVSTSATAAGGGNKAAAPSSSSMDTSSDAEKISVRVIEPHWWTTHLRRIEEQEQQKKLL